MQRIRLFAAVMAALLLASPVLAATYYVDYAGGDDTAAGTTPDAAWQHCPGDSAATDAAKAAELKPGDTVILKGGVRYAGAITCTASGTEDRPITLDGNTAGTFGQGRALIDGGTLVEGWQRCASADDAAGNPSWQRIVYAEVPKPPSWKAVNLCTGQRVLPIAQEPDPSDTFFQERVSDFYKVDRRIESEMPGRVYPEKDTHVNTRRPLVQVVTEGRGSAVVSPVPGAAFSIELDEPVTVEKVGISMQPKYTAIKQVAFLGDGELLCRGTLDPEQVGEMETFELDAPATFRKLTVRLVSTVEEKPKHGWTAIRRVGAFAPDGTNLLAFDVGMSLSDPEVFTHPAPDYYLGMKLAFHGGHNFVHYLNIDRYDPATHTVYTGFFGDKLYKTTSYSLMNSVKLIDEPGEYSIEPAGDGKTWRLYLMQEPGEQALPTDVAWSAHNKGISVEGASHVVVQGFDIRRQGRSRASGLNVRGGENITLRDCDVSLVNGGAAVNGSHVKGILVEGCRIHHNPGHTKGLVLHTCTDAVTRRCVFVKNSSTGLDYYNCHGGLVSECRVEDHYGMHANGITFYIGCKDLVIERNLVLRGHVGLTIQEAENIIIRNNIIDSFGDSMSVGIWTNTPFKNVQFLNNTFIRSKTGSDWAVGLFSNNRGPEGLVIRNNVIDGLSGNLPAEYSHNLYTRWGSNQEPDPKLQEGELYETDLSKLFVDVEAGDYRPAPGSPLIDAGARLDVSEDFDGTERPQGQGIDIGAQEYVPAGE